MSYRLATAINCELNKTSFELSYPNKINNLEQHDAQKCLRVIFITCQVLLHQNLHFRGHEDAHGNFQLLLNLRAHDVPELQTWLDRRHDFTQNSERNFISFTVFRTKSRSLMQL
jgi:hypothetical protein